MRAGAAPHEEALRGEVPVPVTDVLAYLAGTWHVERTVADLAGGGTGTFDGTTVFAPLDPDGADQSGDGLPGRGERSGDGGDRSGLLHHESGTFRWQGTPRPAERTLRYLPGEHSGTARVEFSDRRFFHDLDLRTGAYVAYHPCAADLYRGEFTVLGADRWRTRWRVTGPAKDLVLVTDYTRARRHTPPPRPVTGRTTAEPVLD